jgi:hypothetical protein
MIDPDQFKKEVIEPALSTVGLYSPTAVQLLLATAIAESGLVYIRQHGEGPAMGVYQIEPATRQDCHDNFINYRTELEGNIKRLMTGEDPDQQLISNLSYATIIARIVYYRAPEELPALNDLEGYANYWKQHYNTHLGAGTTMGFIDKVGDFL